MSSGFEQIFGELHPEAFKLFSGSSRQYYAKLLEFLSEELFEDAGMAARGQVIDAIKEFSRLHPDLEADSKSDIGVRANLAYGRLLETGWLVEQRNGFQRFSDFEPTARLLLDFLLDVKFGRLRSYGGEVLQVLALIESVDRDPEGRSEALRGAAKSARSFLNHLRGLSASMRKAEDVIASHSNFADLFESFFADYVQKHLISDYKLLNTRANPFRFRIRIISIANRMLEDDFRVDELAGAYVREGRAVRGDIGREMVVQDLRTVLRVFDNIDDYLAVIEDTNKRVEARIRNTIRFLDSMQEADTQKLERLIEKVAATKEESLPVIDDTAHTYLPVASAHLYAPNTQRPAIAPTKIQRPQKSAAQRAHEQAILEYQERSRVTPDRIGKYLEEHVAGKGAVEGRELPIKSLDDFFVFERLRSLPYLAGGKLAEHWEVFDCQGTIKNDWILCRNFIIRPRGAEHVVH